MMMRTTITASERGKAAYMPKLDCGHAADRLSIVFCNTCIERLVARAERAERLLQERDQTISDLAQEIKRLEKKA